MYSSATHILKTFLLVMNECRSHFITVVCEIAIIFALPSGLVSSLLLFIGRDKRGGLIHNIKNRNLN